MTAVCRCGHTRHAHQHYRDPGTVTQECALCDCQGMPRLHGPKLATVQAAVIITGAALLVLAPFILGLALLAFGACYGWPLIIKTLRAEKRSRS